MSAVEPPPQLDLSGRSALVTGGASGIGAAVARRLAAAGAAVTVADHAEECAREMADELGGTVWAVDLADTASLAGARVDCDILVNNAGFQHVAPIEEFPPDVLDRLLRVLLHAPMLLVRAALPRMYANGYGRVVHLSSVHGLVASPYKSAYVAAKHGLEGFSKVVALEGATRGVTSNCVCPGYVRTPLVEGQISDQARAHGVPEDQVVEQVLLEPAVIKRLIEPDEVADAVAYLCSPAANAMTGNRIVLDGGWTAH